MPSAAPDANTEESAPRNHKRWKFPTAFTVLALVLLGVWGVSFVVPAGSYDYVDCGDGTAKPVPGSYHEVDLDYSAGERLYDLWLSPVTGLYGLQPEQPRTDEGGQDLRPSVATADQILETCRATLAGQRGIPPDQVQAEDAEDTVVVLGPKAQIGADETGTMAGAVQVFFFVLAIGAFITVTMRTGALDAGIAALVQRFRTRAPVLIVVLMVVFSLGGTTFGLAEETLGFYALIVPIVIALGYDRMVAVGIILLGAGIGTLASTVNPFATGVASDGADVEIGNGIGLRFLMYLVLTTVAILYVLRYAHRVKTEPSRSLVGAGSGAPATDELTMSEPDPEATAPVLTGRQKLVLWVFGLTFGIMVFSVIPWGEFSPALESITLGWFFPQLSALFLLSAVLIGVVGRLGEEGTVNAIIAGMGDFMAAAFVIVVARAVTVIMNNAGITDTVLAALEGVVTGLSSGIFAVVVYLVNVPLAFLVPSSSGQATLTMPILAPLADFANVSRAMVVTGFQSASGLVNLVTPTSAVVMGGLALAKVGYDKYVRFVAPLLVILVVLTCLFMLVGVATPLGGT